MRFYDEMKRMLQIHQSYNHLHPTMPAVAPVRAELQSANRGLFMIVHFVMSASISFDLKVMFAATTHCCLMRAVRGEMVEAQCSVV
jgi:hypothetical protein